MVGYVLCHVMCLFIVHFTWIFYFKKSTKYGMYWFKTATPRSGHQTNDNVPRLLMTGWDVFTLYCTSKLFVFSLLRLLNFDVEKIKFWIKTCEISWSRTPQVFHYCLTDFDRWNYNFCQWMLVQDLISLRRSSFFLFSWAFLWFLSSTKHCICSWNLNPTDHRWPNLWILLTQFTRFFLFKPSKFLSCWILLGVYLWFGTIVSRYSLLFYDDLIV